MTIATIIYAPQSIRRGRSEIRWWGSTKRLCAVALMPIVSACTVSPGLAAPTGTAGAANMMAAAPVTTFDGSYRTTVRVVGSFGGNKNMDWCQTSGQLIVTIKNGEFTYDVPHSKAPRMERSEFPATFAADGSFYGQVVAGTMYGQVRGTHLEGRIDGSMCLYAFSGDRTDSFRSGSVPRTGTLRKFDQQGQQSPSSGATLDFSQDQSSPPNLPPPLATRGSSTPPGSNLPGLAPLPPPSPPLSINTSPPVPSPAGQVYATPQGPVVTTGGTSHYQSAVTPGGGSAIVIPGNGSSTIIHSDGRIEVAPRPR